MQMTGRQALLEIFRRGGVEYIFGISGGAEGYARVSGKAGVLNLHTGTGLSAALPMLSNAYQGGVPLVVTAGQQDTRLQAYEPALMGQLVRLASPFTHWATEILHTEDIPTVIRRAFKVATHPPTGPVFVSLPQDIMNASLNFEYEAGTPSHFRI